MREDFADQTQFAAQEPLLIRTDATSAEAQSRLPQQLDPLEQSKAKRKKLILFSIFAFLFLLLLLLGLLFLRGAGQRQSSSTPNIQSTTKSLTPSEFDIKIKELKNELESADPSVTQWPFPPVDLQASLFEIEEQR